MMPDAIENRKLGEILVSRNILTDTSLERMLFQSISSGQDFSSFLLENNLVTAGELAWAIARVHGISFYQENLSMETPPQHILRLISYDIAVRLSVFPLKRADNTLLVATHTPHNIPELTSLLIRRRLTIVPSISPKTEIINAISRCYERPSKSFACNQLITNTIGTSTLNSCSL